MCGIIGFIGKIPEQANEDAFFFLRHLFIQSKSRGSHASGFAAVHGDSPLIIEKRAIPSDAFVHSCSRFNALRQKMPSVFIGHTRHATTGHQSRGRNNHPFNSPRYTMVHNGHIEDWDKLAKSHPINMRSETDSEVIIRLLDEKNNMQDGVQHVIDTVDKTSRIAIGVIKHHEKDNRRLYLFRVNNPIYVATIPAWRAIFFASTQHIIEEAMKSCYGAAVWQAKKSALNMSIAEIPTWQLMEFGIDGNTPHLVNSATIAEQRSSVTSTPVPPRIAGPMLPVLPSTQVPGPINTAGLTPATKKDLEDFNRAAQRVSSVMNSMSTNPFMTLEEVEHWKEWLRIK